MSVLIRLDDEEMDKMVKVMTHRFEMAQMHSEYKGEELKVDNIMFQRIPLRFIRKGGKFDVPTDT